MSVKLMGMMVFQLKQVKNSKPLQYFKKRQEVSFINNKWLSMNIFRNLFS